jgi:hypothetical protein
VFAGNRRNASTIEAVLGRCPSVIRVAGATSSSEIAGMVTTQKVEFLGSGDQG